MTLLGHLLPVEIEEHILIYLDSEKIHELGECNVTQSVWLMKKDQSIQQAIEHKNLVGLKYLIIQDPGNSKKALWMSAQSGYLEAIEYLIERDPSIIVDDYVSLRSSANHGHLDIVEYLIEHGADINICCDIGLRYAAMAGYSDIVMYLIDNGADIHADNDIIMLYFIEHNDLETIKYLVRCGINVHIESDRALRCAARDGRLNIVRYLVEECNADIHAVDEDEDEDALQISMDYGYLDIVQYLVGRDSHQLTTSM
jgi:ankyrin repeat protein